VSRASVPRMRSVRVPPLLGVILVGLGVLVAGAGAQPPGPPVDMRHRLMVPGPARDMVLAEMRRMLESVNAILHALPANDLTAIERAARASGLAMAADVDPQLRDRLPPPFLQLGMATHRGFDELADEVNAGGTREQALAALGRITSNCVACHAIYRLDESR